jgi:nicotinate-nucleotide pyrophosphorylase (carboxylating)
VTTLALVPDDAAVTAIILAREACVVAGGAVAALVFSMLDPDCRVDTIVAEGHRAAAGETLLRIRGRAGAVQLEGMLCLQAAGMDGPASLPASSTRRQAPSSSRWVSRR